MWKAIAFGSYLLHWLEQSAKDGVITKDEMLELVSEALNTFNVDVEIEL